MRDNLKKAQEQAEVKIIREVTYKSEKIVKNKHKVVIVGGSNVGKSCIFLRYAIYSQADSEKAISISQNDSYTASHFTKHLQSGNQQVQIQVWDFHNPEDSVYKTQNNYGMFNVMEEHREEVLSADTVVLVYQKKWKESKQFC
jgi:GTPase SAR1 family protein